MLVKIKKNGLHVDQIWSSCGQGPDNIYQLVQKKKGYDSGESARLPTDSVSEAGSNIGDRFENEEDFRAGMGNGSRKRTATDAAEKVSRGNQKERKHANAQHQTGDEDSESGSAAWVGEPLPSSTQIRAYYDAFKKHDLLWAPTH